MNDNSGNSHRVAPYGLLGRKLGHSWSPQIHASLGSVPYTCHELEPEELGAFVRADRWRGLNVTMPYKVDVVRLADAATEEVRRLGAANTLLRRDDGTILAHNTDLAGFAWMLADFCRSRLHVGSPADLLAGNKALVLGSGGASRAVVAALEDAGAEVVVVSRSGHETYASLAERHADAVLAVNTTPVGMFPHADATPLDEPTLDRLRGLRGVIDIIYNPNETMLCQLAEARGIPAQTGLAMLVAQAKASSELWQRTTIDDLLVGSITRRILGQTLNVTLIGMPGCGKTSTGRKLAHMCKRPFVDLDDACSIACGTPVADYISTHGEDAFRRIETDVLREYSCRSGLVIACGGGIVTRPENHDLLARNSTIVMLDRPIEQLSTKGRPVSAARGVQALATERMGLYRGWANHIVGCTGSASGDAAKIRDLLAL